jgi:hypothetical protein
MSAAPEYFMNESSNTREGQRDAAPQSATDEESDSTFWVWFAVGVLMFCWIAEASMCALRGF